MKIVLELERLPYERLKEMDLLTLQKRRVWGDFIQIIEYETEKVDKEELLREIKKHHQHMDTVKIWEKKDVWDIKKWNFLQRNTEVWNIYVRRYYRRKVCMTSKSWTNTDMEMGWHQHKLWSCKTTTRYHKHKHTCMHTHTHTSDKSNYVKLKITVTCYSIK